MPEHFVPHFVAQPRVAGSMSLYLVQSHTALDSVEIWGPLCPVSDGSHLAAGTSGNPSLTWGQDPLLRQCSPGPEYGLGLVPACPPALLPACSSRIEAVASHLWQGLWLRVALEAGNRQPANPGSPVSWG